MNIKMVGCDLAAICISRTTFSNVSFPFLMILPEYEYLLLVEDFYGDVGHWLPTITPELLTGEFGDPEEKDYFRTEVDGLVSWVTDRDDQG